MQKVKGEGGTGIPKIVKIIAYDLKREPIIDFGYIKENNIFFMKIEFWEGYMQILLIEDNSNKRKQIKEVLMEIYPEAGIEEAYSFNSGVRKVYEDRWNLIVLDMSLPTYDITHTESGGDKKPVAGKNIMKRMLNRKIIVPVVVITQFETFDDDRISLNSLNEEFTKGFRDIWKGTVFYGNDDWSTILKEILDKL